jgi:hypothetical protein
VSDAEYNTFQDFVFQRPVFPNIGSNACYNQDWTLTDIRLGLIAKVTIRNPSAVSWKRSCASLSDPEYTIPKVRILKTRDGRILCRWRERKKEKSRKRINNKKRI